MLTNWKQIEELKAENTALKAQIATLKPKYSWQKFSLYADFTERVEFNGYQYVSKAIGFQYNSSNNLLTVRIPSALAKKEYLLIIVDDELLTSYIRYNNTTNTAHFDEYEPHLTTSGTSSTSGTCRITLPNPLTFTKVDSNVLREFKYVFTKTQ